jgi:hypothetical protein
MNWDRYSSSPSSCIDSPSWSSQFCSSPFLKPPTARNHESAWNNSKDAESEEFQRNYDQFAMTQYHLSRQYSGVWMTRPGHQAWNLIQECKYADPQRCNKIPQTSQPTRYIEKCKVIRNQVKPLTLKRHKKSDKTREPKSSPTCLAIKWLRLTSANKNQQIVERQEKLVPSMGPVKTEQL